MSWREFVASLVDSLAWPVAVVVLVTLLRSQLAALLKSVGPLRWLRVGPAGAEASGTAPSSRSRAAASAHCRFPKT